jgi:DNA-binding CsgD family transcriptional regulator
MISRNDMTILNLLDFLYSCVDGESAWSAFLDALAEYIGASVIGISTNAFLQAVVGVDPLELAKYQKHYLGINPWLSNGRAYPEGKALLTEEILPFHAYRKTAFYNEWGKKNLVTHAVGGAIRASPSIMLFLSINRGDAQGPFGEKERELAQLLMPHVQRAANLHDRINTLEKRAWVLDALAFPMFYVSPSGTVQWTNQAAENLLRRGRGIRSHHGRLRAELAHDDARLQRTLVGRPAIVDQKATGYGAWLRVTCADDGSEMSLFLTRPPGKIRTLIGLPAGASGFLAFVAIQTVDANSLAARVRTAWGLTVAEAALAVELLEGDGLPLAAEKLRISRNTAKTQLSSIFMKTGARRQSELVRKLLAMGALAGPRSA